MESARHRLKAVKEARERYSKTAKHATIICLFRRARGVMFSLVCFDAESVSWCLVLLGIPRGIKWLVVSMVAGGQL